jgi:hypothetical protein
MLLAKEAEQRMVEQETLDRGGDPNEDGEDGKEKEKDGDGSNKDESGDEDDKEARLARRRKRRLRKIARLRRTLRGEDAEDMGGAAARNAAAVAGVDRIKKLSEEEDALAERLLAEFSRDEEAAASVVESSTVVESSAFSVKSGATNVTDTTSHNPFAVPSTLSLLASINHPGTGGAGGLNQVGESPTDEETRRLAEIERALGEFKSTDDRTDAFVSMTTQMRMGAGSPGVGVGLSYAGGGESPGDDSVAVSERPLSAATGVSGASPAPSSASAFARRHGLVVGDAEKENAGGGGSAYLESAREERELKEVSEEVDLRLRRMKTKGEFPARLTPEEMRALVDECRSEQGA